MSWTEPVDEAKLGHWRRLWSILKAFALLDTRRVIDLSQWRSSAHRVGVSAALFTIAVTLMTWAASRFYPWSQGPLSFLNWSITAIGIFFLALSIPALIGYKLLRLSRINFVINIILIQQIALALALAAASSILMAKDPARIDFTLLQEGRGEGTVAYRQYCGNLEASGEILALNERAQARAESIARDLKTVLSWGPPTEAKAKKYWPEITKQFERREAEYAEMSGEIGVADSISEEVYKAQEQFFESYPTFFLAQDFFYICFIFTLLISTIHLGRAALLGDRGRQALGTTIFAIVFTFGVGVGFVWTIGESAAYLVHSNMKLPPLPRELNAKTLEEADRQLAQLRNELVREKEEHLRLSYDLRHICLTASPK